MASVLPQSTFPAKGRGSRPSLSSLVTDAKRSVRFNVDKQHGHGPSETWSSLKASLPALRIRVPSPRMGAFILSCLLWYFSSALSSNTSKALLSSNKHVQPRPPPLFPYPVTLTLAQFFFVHIFSSSISSPNIMRWVPGVRKPITRIVKNPGRDRILDMAKLSVFNVVGHALSSIALSRVPVSTVHTIKALTPLFTVLSFRLMFGVTYSMLTYVSLFPLTLGVMMACTTLSFSANDLMGLATALGSTLVFVAQSIYSKKLIGRGEGQQKAGSKLTGSHGDAHGHGFGPDGKLDKINILYYSSACSVVIMLPMALYYDGANLLLGTSGAASSMLDQQQEFILPSSSSAYITYLLVANGVVHFAQNFLAFSVLALVSPVTYSIASLFKRVFVICFAIVWFGQSVSLLQWVGIVLTFVGLYLYNDSKATKSIHKGEEKLRREERLSDLRLPTSNEEGLRDLNVAEAAVSPRFHHHHQHTVAEPYSTIHYPGRSPLSAGATTSGAQGIRSFAGVGRRFSVGPDSKPAFSPQQPHYQQEQQPQQQHQHHQHYQHHHPSQQLLSGQDPRTSIPSPPPSRRSSSEDQQKLS